MELPNSMYIEIRNGGIIYDIYEFNTLIGCISSFGESEYDEAVIGKNIDYFWVHAFSTE